MSSTGMGCGAHDVAIARRNAGIPAWRYLYSGDWPNMDIGVRGAWHLAEIALVFGTTEFMSHIPDTEDEKKLGEQMRLAWTGFAKNPAGGLTKMGWPVYEKDGEFDSIARADGLAVQYIDDTIIGPVVHLGGENSSEIVFDSRSKFDSSC
jgi:cholinesterase